MSHRVLALLLLSVAPIAAAGHLAPGDVAPASRDTSTNPPTTTPIGDGVVDIADAVLVLRASVGLERLVHGGSTTDARIDALQLRIDQLEALLAGMTRQGDEILISGANLRVVNGLGRTDSTNGLGNVIVGYSEARGFLEDVRTGSHNVVMGIRNNYSSYGGLVSGEGNAIMAGFASVLGGADNEALGFASVIAGGEGGTASGLFSSIAGGFGNAAIGQHSTVAGGRGNEASGDGASVAGGAANVASGDDAAVAGGLANTAAGEASAVAGGLSRTASAEADAVLGSIQEDE